VLRASSIWIVVCMCIFMAIFTFSKITGHYKGIGRSSRTYTRLTCRVNRAAALENSKCHAETQACSASSEGIGHYCGVPRVLWTEG